MAKRKAVSKKTRFEVFKRDAFTCKYCGASAPKAVLHIDHMLPVSKGGDNEILNLVTACEDCNAGKSDRLLSDDSAITQQKAQLDELNSRREQLEMMMRWREGLKTIERDAVEIACDARNASTPGWGLSDIGRKKMAKLVKQFGLEAVLDAIDTAATQYLEFNADGSATDESVQLSWGKVGGIARMSTLPEWKQRLYHIRNIARSRSGETWYPQTNAEIFALFEQAYNEGDSFEQLEDLARRGIGYRELPDVLNRWIKESRQERKQKEQQDRAWEQIARQEDERRERVLKGPEFEGSVCYPDAALGAYAVDILQAAGEMY